MTDYNELHRPQFHFTAKENWINDPNGLVYCDGVWHMYFQHNPESTIWGNMTWGHAISDDLLHWKQLEHALYPDEHGTMFSGSAVIDHQGTAGFGEGVILLFYTAAGAYAIPKREHTQCLAYSTDGGMTVQKYDSNPIVDSFAKGNRDPKVIWHEESEQWIMALFLIDNDFCLLRSTDTKSWERFQDITLPGVSECPDFFPLMDESGNERWIFWGAKGKYLVGSFNGEQFVPETELLTSEHGTNGYAAQTWSDAPDGRRIQISWMQGGLVPEMPFNHQMSIPVELSLVGSGKDVTLNRWPISELETLQKNRTNPGARTATKAVPLVVDTQAKLLDVTFSASRRGEGFVYITVRGQPMVLHWKENELRFKDRSIPLGNSASPEIRILVDKASIEIFIDRGLASASFNFLPGAYEHPLTMHSDDDQDIDILEVNELDRVW